MLTPRIVSMVKIDLNRISVIGLLLFAGAVIVLLLAGDRTVGSLLGEGAPLAEVYLWMVVAVAAMLVYIAGRLIWLIRNNFGVPERSRRRS